MRYYPVFIMGLLLLLVGCTSTGSRVDPGQLNQIVRGQTTEQEVIQRFGQPTSVAVSPTRKTLVYDYLTDNRAGKHAVASTASVLGGIAGGALGSLAGSLVGSNAVPDQSSREVLRVDIDQASGTVSNFQFQQSRSGV